MKLEDLIYNKVLGYEPNINKISVPSQRWWYIYKENH